MMDNIRLWDLIMNAWTEMGEVIEKSVDALNKEVGLEYRLWGLLLAVRTYEPETTTPADLLVRSPYSAAEKYLSRLRSAAAHGYLAEMSPGSFRLTNLGRQYAERFISLARAALTEIRILPEEELERLGTYLGRLVRESLNTDPPPETWSIRGSYQLMPEKRPAMPYIEQAITCLAAYRDDSHLASWQSSGISATALETLTFIWRNEANSLDEICQKLGSRGHSRNVYAANVSKLMDQGYLRQKGDQLFITESGRTFRNQVEEDTNRYFFIPWASLKEDEKKDLANLCTSLLGGFQVK